MAKKKRKSKTYGWLLTLCLCLSLAAIFCVLWALFISGPSRIHEETVEKRIAAIKEQVSNIQGLSENTFEYITYQGFTDDTLYWFDMTGQIITTRDMNTLDYNKAKETAKSLYGIDTDVIELAYGYTTPVYQITGSGKLLMLDYDSLEKVYERQIANDRTQ